MKKIDKYKPAVTKHVLLCLAGFAWVCVGVALLLLAFSWLSKASHGHRYLFAGAGVVLALLVHRFAFMKIVDRNVNRILPMEDKQCLFSFIPWKSYLIIAVMITMGAILRHSIIPKPYLAILYSGIGLALILSGARYIRVFFRERNRQGPRKAGPDHNKSF